MGMMKGDPQMMKGNPMMMGMMKGMPHPGAKGGPMPTAMMMPGKGMPPMPAGPPAHMMSMAGKGPGMMPPPAAGAERPAQNDEQSPKQASKTGAAGISASALAAAPPSV